MAALTSYICSYLLPFISRIPPNMHSEVYTCHFCLPVLLPPSAYSPEQTSTDMLPPKFTNTSAHPACPTTLLHACDPTSLSQQSVFTKKYANTLYQTVHTSLLNSRLSVEIPSQSLVLCLYVCKVPTPKNIRKACSICSIAFIFLIDLQISTTYSIAESTRHISLSLHCSCSIILQHTYHMHTQHNWNKKAKWTWQS